MSGEFSAWLKRQCDRREQSMREVSIQAGLNPGTVRYIINHPESQPTTETCKKLAKSMGVEIDLLLGLAGHRPQNTPKRLERELSFPEISYYMRHVPDLSPEDQELLLNVIKPIIERALRTNSEPNT